jgi:hypothetical protein
MARRKTLQTNFSAGELAPELGMRQDTDQYKNGAKSLLNMRCLIGGGVTRRPGTRRLAELTQDSVDFEFVFNQTTVYNLCFSAGRMDAILPNGTAAGSVTSAPWTGTIWSEMDYVQSGNTIILTHPSMVTQKIVRTSGSTWSRSDFAFYVGQGGRTEQPYYKVADSAITLAPSALTGSVTLQTSAAFFTAARIGQKIRYLGREITITAVTDADTATGTVVETLPTTQSLTVTSSANFAVGQEVLGNTSGAHALVTAIPDGTHLTVVIDQGLTLFSGAEDILGPNGKTTISAQLSTTPAAVTDWDEALFHVINGYPSCIALHRNRILFAGHPAVPNALIGSSIGNLFSFFVGTGGDADGFLETIGDDAATKIVQLYSAEQLLIATDRGLYYVPESVANPFRPTSLAFFPFGSRWSVSSTAKMRGFDNGVLLVSGSLVIMARPTGNVTQSWSADEVSLLSSHIITTPSRLAAVSNFNGGPERYAMIVNSDGTMAAMQIVDAQKIRNVSPWTTDGEIRSAACLLNKIYVTTRRTISGTTRYFLEVFDQDVTLDLTMVSTDLTDVTAFFGSTEPNVVTGNFSLGTYPLAIEDPPAGPYDVGLYYNTRTEPLPPALDDNEGSMAGQFMRITECYVHVLNSARFAQNGYELAAYQVTDDPTLEPPLRTGPQRFQFQGWVREPTVSVTQPDPLPLQILAMKTTVAI